MSDTQENGAASLTELNEQTLVRALAPIIGELEGFGVLDVVDEECAATRALEVAEWRVHDLLVVLMAARGTDGGRLVTTTGTKLCLGCRRPGRWGRSGRCPQCQHAQTARRDANPHRRAVKAVRYDAEHRRNRRRWRRLIDAGHPVNCHRCGERIRQFEPFDLDHHDDGNTSTSSHPACNRAAPNQRGDR